MPAEVDSLKTEGGVYVFKLDEINFLRAYSVHLDEKVAQGEARVDHRRISEILNNDHVKREMQLIQRAWRYRGRLTQEFAGGEHARLAEKFEKDYDDLPLKERPKMAGVLAKVSETTAKMTGLIGTERQDTVPTVIINLDMGQSQDTKVAVQINQTNQEGTSDASS